MIFFSQTKMSDKERENIDAFFFPLPNYKSLIFMKGTAV